MKQELKESKPKNLKLELELYFSDAKELVTKLFDITGHIEKGVFTYNDVTSKFNVLFTKEPKFRFEEYDGQEYIVFESKMND